MSNVYLFSLSKIHHLFGYALLYQFQLENKIMILLHVTIEEAETSQLGGVCIVSWEACVLLDYMHISGENSYEKLNCSCPQK